MRVVKFKFSHHRQTYPRRNSRRWKNAMTELRKIRRSAELVAIQLPELEQINIRPIFKAVQYVQVSMEARRGKRGYV